MYTYDFDQPRRWIQWFINGLDSGRRVIYLVDKKCTNFSISNSIKLPLKIQKYLYHTIVLESDPDKK